MNSGIDHAVDVLFETSLVHFSAVVCEWGDQSNKYTLQLLRCHCDQGDVKSQDFRRDYAGSLNLTEEQSVSASYDMLQSSFVFGGVCEIPCFLRRRLLRIGDSFPIR